MIEIRTFEGDANELSTFVTTMWRKTYEGRMPVPLWSPEFLGRDLLPGGDADPRDYLVAAYDGPRLVGLHPARPMRIRLHGQEFPGSMGSWLTVDPDYRRQGLAAQMQEEFERRHRERGALVDFGYLYTRTSTSMGKSFWLKYPKGTTPVGRLGLWQRALDHQASARWELYRVEAWGVRALSLSQRAPGPPRDMTGIRPYRPEDVPACVELVRRRNEARDLAYVWDADRLGQLLEYGDLARTVVLEQQGHVAGLVNYCRLSVLGKYVEQFGVLDMLAFGVLSHADRLRLLRAAMGQMAEEGLKGAMMVRGSWYGARTMLAAGFFPMTCEYTLVGTKMQDDVRLDGVRRLHVLWR